MILLILGMIISGLSAGMWLVGARRNSECILFLAVLTQLVGIVLIAMGMDK